MTDKNRREWLWAHWTESCRPCPRTSTPSPPHPIPTRDLLRGSHTLPVCHLPEPGCRTVWDRPIDFVVSSFLKADAPSLLQQFVCLQSAPFLSSSLCVHHVLSLTVLTAKSLDWYSGWRETNDQIISNSSLTLLSSVVLSFFATFFLFSVCI